MSVASSSRSTLMGAVRCLSSTPVPRAVPRRVVDRSLLTNYQFDDTTSLGYLRMIKIKEAADLVAKSEAHELILRAQAQQFKPPTSPIRLTTVIDLTFPDTPVSKRCTLLAPVLALPLGPPEAVHRLKLLAGPRWTPGRPGRNEMESEEPSAYNAGPEDIGKEGWVKISEDRFADARMNRKSASDMLDRLVEAATDPNSPLSADLPLDTRHVIARQRKKQKRLGNGSLIRYEAMKARPEVVGGIQGFPLEWLPEEKRKVYKRKQGGAGRG